MGLELVPDDDAERLWTVPELAKKFSVSRNTIYERIDNGEFGPYIDTAHSGDRKARRVPHSGVKDYEAARTIHPRRTA